MAIETTPLGFQKPDGNEAIRNGDNVISANAQKSEDLLANVRARVAQVESAAGFPGTGLDLADAVVHPLLDTATTTRNKLDARYIQGTHEHSASSITSGQLADARMPSRLGAAATQVTDWNLATSNGYYYGLSSALNTTPGGGNVLGYVVATATAVTQWGWAYQTDSAADTKTYRRDLNGSTWSAWARVRESEVELDARYAQVTALNAVGARTPLSVMDYGAVGDATTNNNAAIQAAVDAAGAQGRELYWPYGTYLKTANITNFHSVRHSGQGIIQHGTDLFYVEPTGVQANKLYVNPTASGVDTYDGLSAAFPLKTLNATLAKLPNYGPVLRGVWTVQLAAGTYNESAVFPKTVYATSTVTIQGPTAGHPNVPTAIISRGYNVTAVGLNLIARQCSVTLRDILVSGFNGSVSSSGIDGSDGMQNELFCINVHTTDCYYGITAGRSAYDVKGGIHTRAGYLGDTANNTTPSSRNGQGAGVRSLMHSRHAIGTQSAGNLNAGPYFLGCKTAGFVQESSTGHFDWVRVEDCETGLNIGVNSRVNMSGTSFKRNTIDIRATSGSVAYITGDTAFGTGADETPIKIITASGAMVLDDTRIFTNITQGNGTVVRVADTKFPNTTVTSTVTQVVYTATLGAMVWRNSSTAVGLGRRLVVKIYGQLSGTNGAKDVTVRFGSAIVSPQFTATETGGFEAEATIFFTGTATQLLSMKAANHLGASARVSTAAGTNALTGTTNLTVEARVANAADSVTIQAVDLSWA